MNTHSVNKEPVLRDCVGIEEEFCPDYGLGKEVAC